MARLMPSQRVSLVATAALAGAVWSTATAAPALGRIEGAVRLTIPARSPLASGAYAPRAVTRLLADLPPGTYRLSAWQERLGEKQVSVQVQPGRTTHVEINLPLDPS
jgi:hypothetical protein